MAGIRGFRRAVALMAALGAAVAGTMAGTASEAAEGDPVITWPEITALNPANATYTVTTQYEGAEFLYLTKSASATFSVQRLPATGTRDVVFPSGYDGPLNLTPVLCPTDAYSNANCRPAGESRTVQVYDELVTQLSTRVQRGPASTFAVSTRPVGGQAVDVEWEVLPAGDPNGTPLVTGTAAAVPASGPLPAIGASTALVEGERYLYRARLTGTVEPYGELVGEATTTFTWDSHVDATGFRLDSRDDFLGKTHRDVNVFYPARDRYWYYRDAVRVVVLPGGGRETLADVDVVVSDLDGNVVRDMSAESIMGWDGRNRLGRLVPEGMYLVDVTATDQVDNQVTFQRKVQVSHDQLVRTTWEKTVRPKRYLIDKHVGRCGELKSPARRGWRGSFGFRSSPRCGTTTGQVVSTVYGMYLPRSPLGRYDRYDEVQVTTYGGAPRSGGFSYLVQWYWSEKDDDWIGRAQLPRRLGAHPGVEMGSRVVLGDEDEENPYVIWSAGLSEGAKYDVKSFTVRARYWDLR